ncbi:hemerythrin domain-containing protein [Nocardioides sp.]|uniref:hemerythrin domain-containing protein n=1 Tax=Nocardioides sp. TaxID=35761 RepID=UPI0037849026
MTTHDTHDGPQSRAWPRQLRLPGQAAAPEGPIDMQTMYLMHHGFRRDLDAFAAAVRATPADDRRAWRALADRWELFAAVLHKHHTAEDEHIWPALTALGAPEDVAVLEAMEAEHGEIDPLLDSCAAGLRRLAERTDEDARAALVVRVCAARESLRRHLAHEETEAIAIVQRLVTVERWHELEAEIEKGGSLTEVARIVPWIGQGVPREALDRVFASAPALLKVIWLVTHRRFARREARTFRHA